jgi:hypothetical protein
MRLRRKPKPDRSPTWRIIHEVNELNGKKRWIVFKPGFVSPYYSRSPERHEFTSLEEATAFYAEKAGWVTIKTEYPKEKSDV